MPIQKIAAYTTHALSAALPLFFCWLTARFLYLLVVRKKTNFQYELMLSVFAAYFISLLEITVVRFANAADLFYGLLRQGYRSVQLLPLVMTFAEWKEGWWAVVYPVLGNIVWFLPFGFLAPYLFPRLRAWRKIAVAGALLSFCIEALQWLFGTGISDIDDILFNLGGAVIGYGCFLLLDRIGVRFAGRKGIPK